MRYLIVGGSVAGLSCAEKIRGLDETSELIVLSEEERAYSRMSLPYVLSGEVKEEDIWLEIPEGVKFLQKKVTGILPYEGKVITEQAEEFTFDKLLIASGASAATPDFEGNTSPFVFTVRNLSDIWGMREKLENARQGKIIISGAGLVSIEMGDAVNKLGYKPVFLVSSNKVLSMILDDEGSDILKKDMTEKGIDIHFGENIRRVEVQEGKVLVEAESGEKFRGDLVITGKGASPNIEFLSSSGIEVERGVIVDEFFETSKKGIFAAGDVCQGYDIVYGEKRVNALWPVAIEQGRYAAMNMAGLNIPYKGSVARNVVTAFGNTVFTVGLSRGEELETRSRREQNRYSKIVIKDGRLAGVIFINVKVDPGAYLFAIEREAGISGLEDVLLSGSLSYTHLYSFLGKA